MGWEGREPSAMPGHSERLDGRNWLFMFAPSFVLAISNFVYRQSNEEQDGQNEFMYRIQQFRRPLIQTPLGSVYWIKFNLGDILPHPGSHPTKYCVYGSPWTSGRCPVQNRPFSVNFAIVIQRESQGHRPVDTCLSRRVSQEQPAGVPRILLKFMCSLHVLSVGQACKLRGVYLAAMVCSHAAHLHCHSGNGLAQVPRVRP